MILRTLSIVNFRNIASASPEFSTGLNCFVGGNGAGKTNVLDAVHYLSMCKSSLGATDRQSLRHGGDFFVVEGQYSADGGGRLGVSCTFSPRTGKKIRADGKEYDRLADHVGVVPVVMVSPADGALVNDAADERRRWLNAFISQSDGAYLDSLVRYNAVLAERNRLLRGLDGHFGGSFRGEFGGHLGDSDAEILDVLDMQLARHGDAITARRTEIIAQVAPLVAEYYARLADDREEVSLDYRSEVAPERHMADILATTRGKDIAAGYTTSGIHRDDVVMRIGGHPLRRYGSQGQQKSFLVALKLAQFVTVRRVRGERPILLLDDLFDKLDTGRVERLIELAGGDDFGQIFISDCNRARLEGVLQRGGHPYSLFELADGEVSALGSGSLDDLDDLGGSGGLDGANGSDGASGSDTGAASAASPETAQKTVAPTATETENSTQK